MNKCERQKMREKGGGGQACAKMREWSEQVGKAEDEREGGGGQACAKTREWSEQVGKADDEREGGGDETDGQSKDEVEDMELAIVGIGSIRSPLHTTYD